MRKNNMKNRKRHTHFQNAFSVLMIFYVSIILMLLLSTIMSSFKGKSELIVSIIGIAKHPILDNYIKVLVEDHFLKYIFNSVILTTLGVFSVLIISSMGAYGLSRYSFRGRKLWQLFFLLGLMFPIQLGILPNFILLRALGLTNNFLGMLLLYAANISFPAFVFIKFFQILPQTLHEAAKIDGANEFIIFIKIMVPISKPVFVTVGLITAVNLWNDFYLPLVFLSSENVNTMTLAIYRYLSNFLANWDKVFPAVTISLIPIIIMFLFGAEKIVGGLTSGAMKE